VTITLRITAPERDIARVSVRRHQFSVGRPLELDEASPRVAALEYALGAVGGEVVNGLRTFAWRRRVAIDAVEAVVTCELEHELSYLEVIGEQSQPRIASIHVKVFAGSADQPAIRRLFDDMLDKLPLVCTLRAAVSVTIQLVATP
jgi:hypothetical protein